MDPCVDILLLLLLLLDEGSATPACWLLCHSQSLSIARS